jgi:tetratricopeptide (TPR) repeat protein
MNSFFDVAQVQTPAEQMVAQFVARFKPAYRELAAYAALPLLLTPELVSYLRTTFLYGKVPWIAEADLLLSPLCKPVGYEQYAMDGAVRALLLDELDATERERAARLVVAHLHHLARTRPLLRDVDLLTQQWAAMAYLDDQREQVVREMAQAFQHTNNASAYDGLRHMTQIIELLAPQFVDYPQLVYYAQTVAQLLRDSTGTIAHELARSGALTQVVEVAGVKLPSLETIVPKELFSAGTEVSAQAVPTVRNFIITIRSQGERERFAVKIEAEAGTVIVQPFELPFPVADLPRQRNLIMDWIKRGRSLPSQRQSNERSLVAQFGGRLFSQLFKDEVLKVYRSALAGLRSNERVSMLLRLPSELASLPWELLYDPSEQSFLALDSRLTLARYSDLPQILKPLSMYEPLRVVAVLASPQSSEYAPLDLDGELARLQMALNPSQAQGRVQLDVIRGPDTLRQLRVRLRESVYVLHIACHSHTNLREGEEVLVFEDANGREELINNQQLQLYLQVQSDQLRLVVLNTFSSVGAALLSSHVPRVVAMQFHMMDDAAADFAEVFYQELAAGEAVGIALGRTRQHLYDKFSNGLDWSVPVLYLQGPDGKLFEEFGTYDTTQATGRDELLAQVEQLDSEASRLQAQEELAAARPYFERALAIREQVLGSSHPDTATSLSNLGYLFQAQGELAAARPYFERALAIREQVLGPTHPDTASSLWWMGIIAREQQDLDTARSYLQRAVTLFADALGEEHPTTRRCKHDLAALDAPEQADSSRDVELGSVAFEDELLMDDVHTGETLHLVVEQQEETVQMRQDEIDGQRQLLETARTHLATLLQQQMRFGAHVPTYILTEIIKYRGEIARIKQLLRNVGVAVADHANDTAASDTGDTPATPVNPFGFTIGGDVVFGDKVGGDKVGGDKVGGNTFDFNPPPVDIPTSTLRQVLADCFNDTQLNSFLFDYYPDVYKENQGQSFPARILALLVYCEREGTVPELIQQLWQQRRRCFENVLAKQST